MATTTKKTSKEAKTIKITLVRSTIGCTAAQKKTVQALGLSKINQTKVMADIPSVRGAIAKVSHLVRVDEQ